MSQLINSAFLHALGYAIVNSFWQFALLWLIYVLLNTILKLSSHQKYVTGLLIQFGGFIWFIVTFTLCLHQYTLSGEVFFPLQKACSFHIPRAENVSDKFSACIIQIEKFLPCLSAAYLLLLMFSGIKWIKAYNFTKALKTKGLHNLEADWQLFVNQLSAKMGIKSEVKIFLSELVKTPLTIGFFKPLILIPVASVNHLSAEQMEAVILHELAHIKRFDYLFNLFLALIETILFFNPFMLLISRHVKRERENCCDDWVLKYNYNATSYAVALLQVATGHASSYLLTLKAADNKQALLYRIKRIIEKKEITLFNHGYQFIALFVVITILGSVAILSSQKINTPGSSTSGKVISKQMTAKLNDPLFFPLLSLAADEEKTVPNKEQQNDKNLKHNLHSNNLFQKDALKRIIEINRNINKETLPAEAAAPVVPDFNLQTEEAEKNTEILNNQLAEISAQNINTHAAECEIATAKEKLKNLALNLLEKSKNSLNQKQILDEIKAAFEQIKGVQTQLELNEKLNAGQQLKQVDFLNFPQLEPFVSKQIKISTKKMQRALDQAKENYKRSFRNFNHSYNYNLTFPPNAFSISADKKQHSFSFEFNDKPAIKTVLIHSAESNKKAKKMNRVLIEDDGDSVPANLSPAAPLEALPEILSEKKPSVIRI